MDDGSKVELSLILPAYNEAAGIIPALLEADRALGNLGISYEIIVIDDGSADETADLITDAAHGRPNVRLVRHTVNRGYGAALRTGFAEARGSRIAFTDADCQFDLADLGSLVSLTDHHPIAVGYRNERQDSWLRKFYSRGYNLLARCLLGTKVRDIDCALKVFRRDALDKILPETNGFFVNTEMLRKARQQRLAIAEAGVTHRPRQRGVSKVSVRDIPRVLNALLPYWWTQVVFPGRVDRPDQSAPGARTQMLLMFALFGMTCLLFLARLDSPLLEPEEARYAEIPRQMLLEGRLVTPVLHGEDYWQKPPLFYWLVMLSYQIFGVHDWAARLVPALAGIASVGIVAGWAWRTLGFWTGLVSGAILTLSVRFLYVAGMLTLDGLLCTCVIAGLAAGHLALVEPNKRWRWLILSALACALGILAKGPVALLLIGTPLLALAYLDRRIGGPTWKQGFIYGTLVLFIAGPWFALMAARAPEAAGAFFWQHNLTRYLAPIDHQKPAWFYLPSLLLGMLPWSLLLIPLAPYLLRKSRHAGQRRPMALGVFVLAFAWCLLFFSLSGCKRPAYILPALPLLALILGTFVTHGLPWTRWMQAVSLRTTRSERVGHRWARRLALAALAMGASISVAAGVSGMGNWPGAALTTMLFAAVGLVFVCLPFRAPTWTSWAICSACVFLVLAFGQRVWLSAYHDRFGLRRQVEISAAYEQEADLPIVSYPKRWDSISYYTRREVESYTPADFAQLIFALQRHGKALVFVRREGSLAELVSALPDDLEMEMLGRAEDFIVVGLVRPRNR